MPFDAGMFAATVHEINKWAIGAKIEKIHQPEKEEIVLVFHDIRIDGQRKSLRLVINAGTNNPKISFSHINKENPATPPMFCLLMRKHLSGAKLEGVCQLGFERAMMIEFSCRDEMGFACTRYIVCEIMGKYSNLILLDDNKKIITAMKLIDFATSKVRQILPGMLYENPPEQKGKCDPLSEARESFVLKAAEECEKQIDKYLISSYYGLSPLIAREISYRAAGSVAASISECGTEKLADEFFDYTNRINNNVFDPYLVSDSASSPVEFSFMPIMQYGEGFKLEKLEDFGALTDKFFEERDRNERIKQKAGDLLHIINNAQTRLSKKIVKLTEEFEATAECEKYRHEADLITSNIYMLKKGMESVKVIDYYSDGCPEIEIKLDKQLAPSQNAQVKYKKYTKLKNAKVYLTEQIEIAQNELLYIESVSESLSRADGETELSEIREELLSTGFASKMKSAARTKKYIPKPLVYYTSGGYKVLCGKNNMQNDYITFHMASKGDIWFHAKNRPGSHVIMICDGEEPSEKDYTEAAMIAAYNSKSSGDVMIEVDYTKVKNIKKPSGAKPGFVIYHTNYSTLAKRDVDAVSKMLDTKR